MLNILRPYVRVQSVGQISVDWLRTEQIDALLMDADCTLKRYRDEQLTPEATAWLESLRDADIPFCLVSNGRGRRIGRLAGYYGIPFVASALKPLPLGCLRAMKMMGFDRRRTAMVGDQLFADILAGCLAGLKTILVEPIHPEEEPWFTRLKRPLERWLLGRNA